MGALLYVVRRTIINYIKSLKKKPGQIVIYVIFLALFIMMFAGSASGEFNSKGVIPPDFRSVIFAAFPLIIMYFTVSGGLKKGSTFYRMADVNFVFPSPIDRRSILLYGFLRQIGMALLFVMWLLFQIANVQNLFGVPSSMLWLFFGTIFVAVLYIPVCSMIIHASVIKHPHRKTLYNRIFMGVFALLGAGFLYLMVQTKDPLLAANTILGSEAFSYVPILGWLKVMMETTVVGFTTYGYISAGLLVLTLGGLVWYLLSADIDYFEEVLQETERKEKLIQDKREGRVNMGPKKVRKAKSYYRGTGPKAIFYRHLLEYRKSGFFLLDKISAIMVVAGAALAYFLKDNPMRMDFVLYAGIYMLFIMSMTGIWSQELKSHFIYLMPGSSMAKLWYATLSNHIKHLFDGLVLFLVVGQIFGTPIVHRLLLAGCYAAFGAIYVYGDVLFRRMFASGQENIVSGMLKLLAVTILSLPALVIMIVGRVLAKGSMMVVGLSYVGVIGYAVIISFLVMLLGKGLFERAH